MEGLTCPATSRLEAGGGAESRQNPGPGAQSRPSGNPPLALLRLQLLPPASGLQFKTTKASRGFIRLSGCTCSPPAASPGGLPWEYRRWGSQGGPRPGTSGTGLPLPLTRHFSPGFSGPPADSHCPVCLIFHAGCGKASVLKEERSPSL